MAGFIYRQDRLFCEQVDLAAVAAEVGTPCYVYSAGLLRDAFGQFQRALEPLPALICYALKANANASLCKILASLGCGADVVSGGELYQALRLGFDPQHIVFAGVGKTEAEIRFAINAGIRQLNVESLAELDLIHRTAKKMETEARIALRINPDVAADTHTYIRTGTQDSKFGLNLDDISGAFRQAASLSGIQVVGLHFHLGSQIRSTVPYQKTLKKVIPLISELRRSGIGIDTLDIGGGLSISYSDDEKVLTPEEWLGAIKEDLHKLGCTVIVEPGRSLVGPAGVLVTEVLYLKKNSGKNFLVVDAGMNDLLRPSLYGAQHQILPLHRKEGTPIEVDVVGPVCESADFLGKDRNMIEPEPGEYLAVMQTGAYAASMASNYNGRPRAAEALVLGQRYAVVRQREEYSDLVAGQQIPPLVEEACEPRK
jgi:diaminopimelate decarboxylase